MILSLIIPLADIFLENWQVSYTLYFNLLVYTVKLIILTTVWYYKSMEETLSSICLLSNRNCIMLSWIKWMTTINMMVGYHEYHYIRCYYTLTTL